jgi:hypothetical protein
MTSPQVGLPGPAAVCPGAEHRPRSITGYLLMPRPKDLAKGLLLPITFVLGLLSTGDVTSETLLRAGVVVAAVELLIYPARYQWNDIRGFAADQAHPSAKGRGRLPGPLGCARSRVTASCMIIAARLAITSLLIVSMPGLHLAGILCLATLGVFGFAIVYEILRSVSTGRSGDIPAPLSPGIVALWLTVGGGYVVRGLTGLALAVDLAARPALASAAAVTLWAYGVAFVTSRWALEATAFASSQNGRVVWRAGAHQAREHLLALVRWLPSRIDPPNVAVGDWAPLRGWTSPQAPWNVAMFVAGGAAAVTGRLLCGPCPPPQAMIAAIVGGLMSGAVTTAARRRAGVVAFGAASLLASMLQMESPRPVLGVLPWLLLLGAYLFFSTRTLQRLGHNQLGVAARTLAAAAARLIVGGSTWDAVRRHPNVGSPEVSA